MKKFWNKIKENKILVITCIICYLVLMYCSFNTFIINDDLPYSFFYRTDIRVTNIIQVVKNQIADYFNINSRVFVHMIVQTLLIFGKNLWSVLNPCIIIINLLIINKMIKLYSNKTSNLLNFIILMSSFLMMFSYKWLFYWVAGSVNYIWTSTILLLFTYLYLKNGWNKNNLVNMFCILVVSILHESLLIYMIVFVISDIVYEKIMDNRITKTKFLFFIPILISSAFLLFGPGTMGRINSNIEWSNLSLIQKLVISLPVISKNLCNLTNIKNLLPLIYLILIIGNLLKIKMKYSKTITILLLIISMCCIFLDNGWLYFLLVIVIFLVDSYYHINNNNCKNIIIHLSILAIVYSMAITNDYTNGRPNYFYYLYLIYMIAILFQQLYKKFDLKILLSFVYVVLFALLTNEIIIYSQIGKINEERLLKINQNKSENSILYLRKIPKKFSLYHIDINEPSTKEYFAYRYYLNYYHLDENVNIKFVD